MSLRLKELKEVSSFILLSKSVFDQTTQYYQVNITERYLSLIYFVQEIVNLYIIASFATHICKLGSISIL